MVGGSFVAYERARLILSKMGDTVVHAGLAGTGQAAKFCNNMILGVSMIVVSEAFVLAEKLGLDAQKLFCFVEVFRAVLVVDEPLPGARPGAGLARQPRLPARLYGSVDAEGFETGAGRRHGRRREDAAWRRRF